MQLRRHTLRMTCVMAPAACCQENLGEYGRLGWVMQFPKTQKDLKSNAGGHSAETWFWCYLVLQHLEALYESVSCCSNVNVSDWPGNGYSRLPPPEGPVVSRWQCSLARTPTHDRTILWLLAGEECALACFDLGWLLLSFFPLYIKPPSVKGTLSGSPKMCPRDEPNLIFALWFDLEANEKSMEKLFFL